MTFIRICLLSLSLITSLPLYATCVKGPDFVRTELSGWGVSLALGTINITNSAVQPVGSPLAANVVNFPTTLVIQKARKASCGFVIYQTKIISTKSLPQTEMTATEVF